MSEYASVDETIIFLDYQLCECSTPPLPYLSHLWWVADSSSKVRVLTNKIDLEFVRVEMYRQPQINFV